MKQNAKERRRKQYLAHAVERCHKFLGEDSERIIGKANKEFPEQMRAKYEEFSYDACVVGKMKRVLSKYHIFATSYLYDDCVSVCQIAYMYSIGQCVLHNHVHIKSYINKMLPIFIKCQMRISISVKEKERVYDDSRRQRWE